jgi:tryptophan synthase alpha chain
MSRIAACFQRLSRAGRKALIPYVTAGYPGRADTVALLHAMVQAGADVIELGVPFSDPMADGPVIQRSNEQALRQNVGLRDVLDMTRRFRERDRDTPLVLMGYANPIEAMGTQSFALAAAESGVDGLIVVDYPPEECADFAALVRSQGMDLIFLLAPTSTDERVRRIVQLASGYIYYVSLRGVTGAANLDLDEVRDNMARIRSQTALPVGVGFGIRDGATARAVCGVADAVIIGSRVIQEIEAAPGKAAEKVGDLLRSIRTAMDSREPQ